jgi:PAS domain S-box-containing protein
VDQSPAKYIQGGHEFPEHSLLPAIVNSSDDAISGNTPDGMITSWNPAAERLYGYRAEEIIGQSMALLCPPSRVGESQEILDAIGRGERVGHFDTERLRKDGTSFPVSVTVSPICNEAGRLVGASSIARDITDQQQARGPADHNPETFTYSVAHDLRAPLRAMGGYSGALLEEYGDVLDETGRGYAGRIQAAVDQMETLIGDLLRISAVQRAEMHLCPVDLGAEVARIADDLRREDPDRSVDFTIQRPVEAQGDRTLIRTVLENLVGNAWKFTSGRDGALIEFGTTAVADAPVCCFVRDNGVGFDPAYISKLFTPFGRLHTASEFPGSGVGLASVRQIVERHGGRVWAEGAVGEGATFYFTLDAKEMP